MRTVMWFLRLMLLALVSAAVWLNYDTIADKPIHFWVLLAFGVVMFLTVVSIDVFLPKNRLNVLAGVFFGLMVGILISVGLALVVDMVNTFYRLGLTDDARVAAKSVTGICVCYLVISIVMRTKDDIRFVIPYVEFAKQTKGSRPLILDTSAIVDGRIADLCQSRLFDAPILVPRFVLHELQLIADSADKLKRNRGRRGLDVLNKMQNNPIIDVEIDDTIIPEVEGLSGVDQKLLAFAKVKDGKLATTDYNLTKVAQVREVDVININDLANSLKVVALPGETMQIKIIKPGEEEDQGIGYLDDGTMVVVEGGRNKIGKDIQLSVTSSLQTSAGKMIFGRFEGFAQAVPSESSDRRRPPWRRTHDSGGNNRGPTQDRPDPQA
jgi:uncharacterized protein YacL